jgi:hypothetical protein
MGRPFCWSGSLRGGAFGVHPLENRFGTSILASHPSRKERAMDGAPLKHATILNGKKSDQCLTNFRSLTTRRA